MEEREAPSALERVAVVLGFALIIAGAGLVAVSGLIMPVYGVILVGLIWVGALALAIRGRDRAILVLLTPFAFLGIWLLVAWLGEVLLDWTA